MLVGDVVGELELVEGDHLLHPLLAGGGAVGVDVHPLGHLGVPLARHNPTAGEYDLQKNIILQRLMKSQMVEEEKQLVQKKSKL